MISVTSKPLSPAVAVALLGLFLVIASPRLFAQEQWVDYVVERDSNMMTVSLDLKYFVQKPSYKNLVIVGTRFNPCMNNGFPLPESLDYIYAFSDSTAAMIGQKTKNELVGIMTYKCLAFDVYYVKDTIGIRDGIEALAKGSFSENSTYLTIRNDRNWQYYFEYLFPAGMSEGFLMDQKYLYELVLQGDDLQGLRKVRHWFYFKKLKQRQRLGARLESMKFSVDSINYFRDRNLPYELQVSRMDSIMPPKISQLTSLLSVLSEIYGGYYDGWGTELIPAEAKPD